MKQLSAPKPRPEWTYPKPPRGDWISVMHPKPEEE
jgi:hypothetical protein